jgi:hypothetical protein
MLSPQMRADGNDDCAAVADATPQGQGLIASLSRPGALDHHEPAPTPSLWLDSRITLG